MEIPEKQFNPTYSCLVWIAAAVIPFLLAVLLVMGAGDDPTSDTCDSDCQTQRAAPTLTLTVDALTPTSVE